MSIDKPIPRNNSGGDQPHLSQSLSPAGHPASPYVLQHQLGYPPNAGDDGFADSNRSLKDYLDIILRRRVAVIIFLALSVCISVAYAFLATPLYTSNARLEVLDKKEKSEKRLSAEEAIDTKPFMMTQIEILKSRPLPKL